MKQLGHSAIRFGRAPRGNERGFTLFEMALVLTAMGVVLAALMVGRNQLGRAATATEKAFLDNAVISVIQYAQRNFRLPCPDVNGDGYEDDGWGATDDDPRIGVCDPAIKAGGIPYLTLGIPLSGPVGSGLDRQFVYGVYRGGGDPRRDLTLRAERSIPPHDEADDSYADLEDFRIALSEAHAYMTDPANGVHTTEAYVTGNDGNSGLADCGANPVVNVAFAIAFAGAANADDLGGDFDGAHLRDVGWNYGGQPAWESAKGETCFNGPGKAVSAVYDDRVIAYGFLKLMGAISR